MFEQQHQSRREATKRGVAVEKDHQRHQASTYGKTKQESKALTSNEAGTK